MISSILFFALLASTITTGRFASEVRSPNGRIIVNGRDARDGEFPYQVSIQYKPFYGDGASHICGGSIIDEHHILTAGHCVQGMWLPELLAIAGITELSASTDPHRVNLTVEQTYVRDDYNMFYYLNDIALIRVSPPFTFDSAYVQPIPLRTEQLEEMSECTVSGWGTTRRTPDEEYYDYLQALDVPLLEYELCEELYKDYEYGYFIPGMLCAGYLAGIQDSCKGDSGGPLVCEGQLTGIISWGADCAQPNYPGVYADVAYYREWIASTLAQSFEDAGLLERHF